MEYRMLSGVCENPWERWHDCNIGIWHASEIGFSACRHWFQRRGERSCQGGVCHSSTTPPPPSLCSSAGITVFCTFNFLCLNLTRRFCFRFPLYQTEYDNVTWELRDEKISMVPSVFFFFALLFFFAEEMNWTEDAGFGTNTACIIMKSSSFFFSIQRS